jgi:DNA-binding SARP family transcriptional activator
MTGTPPFLLETPGNVSAAYDGEMAHDLIANLEALLTKGGDGAALRLALASRYLDAGDAEAAVRHAEAAVRLDPEYSAAWKALGQALTVAGRSAAALAVYERGATVAERRGDQQAAKEMRVFSKRLQRAAAKPDDKSAD